MTMFAVCGVTHKDSYRDVAVVNIAITASGAILAIIWDPWVFADVLLWPSYTAFTSIFLEGMLLCFEKVLLSIPLILWPWF